MWRKRPKEITGLKIGFVGFGTSGQMTARLLKAMGAEISYYARSAQEDCEKEGMHYRPLPDLLQYSTTAIYSSLIPLAPSVISTTKSGTGVMSSAPMFLQA